MSSVSTTARAAASDAVIEIQAGVEALLDGPVPSGSIRSHLTRNASTWQERRETRYAILGRGRYRLNVSLGYEPLIDLLSELEGFGEGLRIEPLGQDLWQIIYLSDGIDQTMLAQGRSINETAEAALNALLQEMAGE